MNDLTAEGPRARRVRRGALTAFVDRHHLAWELVTAVLALVYLGVGVAVDDGRGVPPSIVGVLGAIFLVEFFARCADAPSRRAYLRGHWVDLVSSLPLVGGLRSVRLLRLLRLGAAARVVVAAEHHARSHQRERHSFWFLAPVLFVTWFGAAAVFYTFEHDVPGSHVHTFGDALYWAFITATTVGYGDVTPVTSEGRVLAGMLIFVGIGLVGFASSRLTARWLHHEGPQAEVVTRMAALETQLDVMHQLLRQTHAAIAAPQPAVTPTDGSGDPPLEARHQAPAETRPQVPGPGQSSEGVGPGRLRIPGSDTAPR